MSTQEEFSEVSEPRITAIIITDYGGTQENEVAEFDEFLLVSMRGGAISVVRSIDRLLAPLYVQELRNLSTLMGEEVLQQAIEDVTHIIERAREESMERDDHIDRPG